MQGQREGAINEGLLLCVVLLEMQAVLEGWELGGFGGTTEGMLLLLLLLLLCAALLALLLLVVVVMVVVAVLLLQGWILQRATCGCRGCCRHRPAGLRSCSCA